jgi:hypothetical protein
MIVDAFCFIGIPPNKKADLPSLYHLHHPASFSDSWSAESDTMK